MAWDEGHFSQRLGAMEKLLGSLREELSVGQAVARLRADAQAMLFHLRDCQDHPPLAVLLGGTGTGKSTLVNRLLGAELTSASFRRTFTSGVIAAARDEQAVPHGWLGLPRKAAAQAPARGEVGCLTIVQHDVPLTRQATLVDTPDLDGDQPAHFAEADRAFRWAQAAVFLVTPEKYQMTELLPYYRLARRYGLPALFVMNKCDEAAVLDDFRRQLAGRDWPEAQVFAVPRDDAAYEPPVGATLDDLRNDIAELPQRLRQIRQSQGQALANRAADLLGRMQDQLLTPLREQRRRTDRLVTGLRAMAAPEPGIDLSPLTQQLQRRLQEQSVLYLVGPQRVLDRVRQVPSLLMRLPRTAWDLVIRGEGPQPGPTGGASTQQQVPDFPALLADQFTIAQSRIEDLIRGTADDARIDPGWKLPAAEARRIAEEELAELKAWLEQRWNAEPRDTRMIQKLLSVLPGGRSLARWSEAAPYLLAVVLAAHGAFFGHLDLLILGGYGLGTWLMEKLSNEVTARTRRANSRIASRFAALTHEQVERACACLEQRTIPHEQLRRLEDLADELAEAIR